MINFYHRVFYHLYKLAINTGETSAPLTSAMPALAFLQFCNIMTISMLLDISGLDAITNWVDHLNFINSIIVLGVLMLIMNYVYFTTGGRYKKIVKEFKKKPIAERKRGARITLIYALVSIALIFILAPLRVYVFGK